MIKLEKSEFLKYIPKYVIDVAEQLQKKGFSAYLVGGSIRDIFLGKSPNDFDIATNAYPEEIMDTFVKSIPTGAKFGTVTVISEDENKERFEVQVTTFRSEADYISGRWPSKVEFSRDIEDDLKRRDFTINALALDLQRFDEDNVDVSNIVIDLFNGLKDLNDKTIRAVRDPLERFSEDGLRGVRACRLASQLDFNIEPNTFEAIKQTLHVTKLVSIERFRDELMKILLKSPQPSKGLRLLRDCGILEIFIPELLEGVGINQPQFHVDDVFEHSIKTVDCASDDIKLAALFHDIAKPRTISIDSKGIHFYGHDVMGAEMTRNIMKRLKFSNIEVDNVVKLVRWHMFYYPSSDWRVLNNNNVDYESITEERNKLGWSDSAIRRLIQNVGGEDAIDDLMKLRIADAASNPKSEFNPKELDALSQRISEVRAKEMALKVTDLDISGTDLINNFNLTAGPVISDILKYLLDKVTDEPVLNKKIDLLRLSKEYLDSKN